MKTLVKQITILIAMVVLTIAGAKASDNSGLFAEDQDSELTIEHWMTDSRIWFDDYSSKFDGRTAHFNRAISSRFENIMPERAERFDARLFRTAQEGELNIEGWMTDDAIWSSSPLESDNQSMFNTEQESELEIENWMTNDFIRENPLASIQQDSDSNLAIKSWMTDNNY